MMRVAIVDDDPIVCSSLSTILKATGTADIAWTAYDGETAVGQYEEDNPDVLLIDVQMPVMDGLAASRKIIDAHPNAKILILTTFAERRCCGNCMSIKRVRRSVTFRKLAITGKIVFPVVSRISLSASGT